VKSPATKAVATPLWVTNARSASHLLPSPDGASARVQFSHTEGFNEIVIRTKLKSNDTIDFI
jgi:hypothetical protein